MAETPKVEIQDGLQVGIYIGPVGEPTSNIESILASWGQIFEDEPWTVETFGSAEPPGETTSFFNHVPTTERHYFSPFDKILAVTNECREYIQKRSPDLVIQFWQTQTNAPGVVLAGLLTGTPVVTRFVGDIFREYKDYKGFKKLGVFLLSNGICAASLRIANHVIAFGPYGKSELISRGISSDSIWLIPPSLTNNGRFEPSVKSVALRDCLNLPSDQDIAFYAGRLTRHKGMDFLVEVIKQLSNQDNILFLLAGSGPYLNKFKEQFDESTVRCLGYIEHEKIFQYYHAADVYVHPSEFEGVPLSILEAMNCGLPVVARKAGDIGLVTEQTVTSPTEMADLISTHSWSNEWADREMFETTYQARMLRKVVREATSQD